MTITHYRSLQNTRCFDLLDGEPWPLANTREKNISCFKAPGAGPRGERGIVSLARVALWGSHGLLTSDSHDITQSSTSPIRRRCSSYYSLCVCADVGG